MTPQVPASSRRTLLRTAVWTAPLVTVAAAAPAFASSDRPRGAIMSTLVRKYSDKDVKHVEWQLTVTNYGETLSNPVFEFFFEDNAGVGATSFTIEGGTGSWTVQTEPTLTATYTGDILTGQSLSVTVDFVGANNAGGSMSVQVYSQDILIASGSADF